MEKRVRVVKILVFVCMFMLSMGALLRTDAEAAGKYYIKVNKKTNVATVYNSNTKKPVKAFLVSCGYATPTGTFYTKNKYRWRELMEQVYGQYCTRITGSILFHSVWYYKNYDKATMSIREYNKLGTLASHGCIRLNVASAKWIYDNCVLRTKVIIFNGKSKDDPLGKPKLAKITSGKKMGWDPSDPSYKNNITITISGAPKKSQTAHLGSKVKLLEGVKAKTSDGRNLTSEIIATIEKPYEATRRTKAQVFKLWDLGTYIIKYTVKDPKTGKSKSYTVKYISEDIKAPTFYGTKIEDKTVEKGSEIDIRKGIKAKNATKDNLTDDIIIEIKKPGSEEYVQLEGSTYVFDIAGVYDIRYSVVNPSNDKKAEKEVKYTCVEPTVVELEEGTDTESIEQEKTTKKEEA